MPASAPVSRIVITLDGLAGSGKSSLAAALARELGFINFNSGLLYRTIGYLALTEHVSTDNEDALAAMVARHSIALVDGASCGGNAQGAVDVAILLDGQILTADIRSPQVSEATSRASRFGKVRSQLLQLQRDAYPGRNLVAEGRDMGTVVFPEAQVKFFIEASVAVRVQRRLRQLSANVGGSETEIAQQIAREITERDARDAQRSVAPTVAAADAIVLDNSSQPLSETVQKMVKIVKERCQLV